MAACGRCHGTPAPSPIVDPTSSDPEALEPTKEPPNDADLSGIWQRIRNELTITAHATWWDTGGGGTVRMAGVIFWDPGIGMPCYVCGLPLARCPRTKCLKA